VIGVKSGVKAERPAKLIPRFDCKPCEIQVVGKIKPSVLQAIAGEAAERVLAFCRVQNVPVLFESNRLLALTELAL